MMRHARAVALAPVAFTLVALTPTWVGATQPTDEPLAAPTDGVPEQPILEDDPDPGPPPETEPPVPADSLNPVEALKTELDALRRRQAQTEAQVEQLQEELREREAKKKVPVPEEELSVGGSKKPRPKYRQTPEALGWDQWTGGNAMATRVTFAFGDDNLLAGPRDRSPQAGFSVPDDQLFFEQLMQEKRGYETETQLVVYKRMRSYFKHLDAEAGMVLEFENFVDQTTLSNRTVIGDDGSYLKLNYYTKANDFDGDVISLTMFPFDSQRFLLGYTYDITWGGQRIFPNNRGQVPGARLKYDFGRNSAKPGYVYVGAKTARLLNDDINEAQTYYGALGGVGVHFLDWLMFEVNGGYFQRGAFPPQGVNFPGIGGRTSQSFGGSTRVSVHKGMPIGTSIDFRLFKYAPDAILLLTAPIYYDNRWAFSFAGEFTAIGQTLLDWEEPNRTVLVPAFAGASINQVRWKMSRFNINGIYRNLDFVLFNIPGIAPYRASPEQAQGRPEFFVAGGYDYFFEGPRLTPGFNLAFKRPATYTSGGVTTVIRDEDDFETLPAGENAFDILAAKLTLRWDVAPFFVIISEVRYTLDKNRTKFVKSESEAGRERVFQDANITNRLGFFILAQGRW
jgi:hypothetical protein